MRRSVLIGLAFLVVIAVLAGLSRTALPNDALYPARQVLESVGFADPSMDDVDRLVAQARVHVDRAEEEARMSTDRYDALDPAVEAMQILRSAREFLADVPPPDKAIRYARIEGLERKATQVIADRRDRLVESLVE
jgi:hypothetical protein